MPCTPPTWPPRHRRLAASSCPSSTTSPPATPRPLSLATGQTMRIMTGAPMPHGADAVVPVEATDGGTVTVEIRARRCRPARPRGRRGRRGRAHVVLRRGTLLGPGQIALLAAAGHRRGAGPARPRVVVISTGDELVEVGRTPGFGQIVDSNSVMLTAAVTAVGAAPFRVGGGPRRRPAPDRRPSRASWPGRRDHHDRRGLDGRLRHRQGGAVAGRHDAVRQGGDAPGHAAGLRGARRGQGAGVHPARATR